MCPVAGIIDYTEERPSRSSVICLKLKLCLSDGQTVVNFFNGFPPFQTKYHVMCENKCIKYFSQSIKTKYIPITLQNGRSPVLPLAVYPSILDTLYTRYMV